MSTIIKVEANDLMLALKKASLTAKEGYMLSVDPTKKAKDGKIFANLTTCDGNTQTVAHFWTQAKGIEKPMAVCTGLEFANVVTTMAELKKDISIEITSSSLEFTCGTATTIIGVKDKIELLEVSNDANQHCIQLKTDEFKNAVKKGGYRSSKEDSRGLCNLLQLTLMCMSKEEAKLRVVTSDGCCAAACDGAVENINDTIDEPVSYGVACDRLCAVAGIVSGDEVAMFFSNKQLVISNANDFYIFRIFANTLPAVIMTLVEEKVHQCSVTVNSRELDTALSLTMITNRDTDPVCLELKEKALVVTDSLGKTRTEIAAVVTGDMEEVYTCRAAFLKTAVLKTAAEKVVLGFDQKKKPVYINSEGQLNATSLVLPVHNPNLNENVSEEKSDK